MHEGVTRFVVWPQGLNQPFAVHADGGFGTLRAIVPVLINKVETDYRPRLRVAANEDEQEAAIQMIAMKRLAKTCNKNLDTAFAALFPETLQASLGLAVAAA